MHIKKKEPQASGIFHVDQSTFLASQVEAMTKEVEYLMASQSQQVQTQLVHPLFPLLPVTMAIHFVDQLVTGKIHAWWELTSHNQ